jgi:hypothetical protein
MLVALVLFVAHASVTRGSVVVAIANDVVDSNERGGVLNQQ